ncbi:formate dehydrogenase accessory sulfurtransferase FdhD [Paenochrobactrum pullorum]|uniref:formate dehydrogenase accessory sulfurtransferase FdhD n=1 Tax=Paenochrobactrum pullorum TaxID=1324351 RepID=UPI0035BC4FB7
MSNEKSSRLVQRQIYREGVFSSSTRMVPEEVAVAMSFGGTTHAVMMATPDDLEDFAIGFALTEGVIGKMTDIETINIVSVDGGFDAQVTLKEQSRAHFNARRRHMAGPVGCGLCGIESIEQALRPVPQVDIANAKFSAADITGAMADLAAKQKLNRTTHAVHGAGFYLKGQGAVIVREDVGRHNALDKLAGALLRNTYVSNQGLVAVTSRLSVEMVQKSAIIGVPLLAAISAPTMLAIETAEKAGLTLVALVRGKEFDIYTHPERVLPT